MPWFGVWMWPSAGRRHCTLKASRGKTLPLLACYALLLFFATQWYGNKYKIPTTARATKLIPQPLNLC